MTYVVLSNLNARVLPAAGAYYTGSTATDIPGGPWSEVHEGAPTISFRVTYTAGGAGGYPVMRVVWTVPNDSGSDVTMIDPITTVAAGGVCTTDAATNKLVALTDGTSTSCPAIYDIPRWATKVKVEVAELGNVGAPGTVTVAMFGGF